MAKNGRSTVMMNPAAAVSLGAFALQLVFGPTAFTLILFYVPVVYGITAVLVYRHAQSLLE